MSASRRFGVLGHDGRALVTGLSQRAARTLLRWIGRETASGATDDDVRQALRERGVVRDDEPSELEARPGEVRRWMDAAEHLPDRSTPAPPPTVPPPPPTPEPEARLLDPVVLLREGRILEGTIPQLEEALATGALDDELEALRAAEAQGKDRKGAREALEHRQEALACLDILRGTLADLDRLLATGAADGHLDALLAAERAGKDRKGAIQRLETRRDA